MKLTSNQNTLFSLKRKPIVSSYDNYNRTKNYLNKWGGRRTADLLDLSTFVNSTYLDPLFKNPGSNLIDCVKLSNTLYSTNRIYQNLLNYLVNMYYWRYITTPRKIKGVKSGMVKDDYSTVYNKMVEITEGLNIETNFPKLLLNIFKNGQVNIYATGDKNSKSVATIILPNEYCRSTVMTQYGTTQIEFNFTFFNNLVNTPEDAVKVFSIFPAEFGERYEEYKRTNQCWQPLNPKFSTSIMMNDFGFPTFLQVFYDMIDYKNYKLNELDRNTNGLERLVSQEIDMEKTGMELPEIQALHDSMAPAIDGNGTTLVTSPGKIAIHQIQEERSTENKVLTNAYKSIFDNAGFNQELFTGDIEFALQASIYRDLNYVWGYIDQISNFYNVALNNIFNFYDYQLSFRLLPISQFNEKDKLELYNKNATLGIGIVDLIVASGIKQVDLESTLEMDKYLDLTTRLVPLQSSHTQSSSTSAETSSKESKDKNNQDGDKVAEKSAPSKE